MNKLSGLMFATMAASGVGIADRIADPIGWHEHNYTMEGPKHTEGFYVSVNWYDQNGNKHDDRAGDALLAAAALSGVGIALSQLREVERLAVRRTV